jgi:hypothetical protein
MQDFDDEDAPELSEEQLKIMDLVLSNKGVRGYHNRDVSFYFQGMEEERVKSIRNIMQSLNLSAIDAMKALKIPGDEHEKYKAVI